MIANEELRRNWRMNWLRSIQEFADLDTQRRLWLDPDVPNRHYTFVEYMCSYFDDLAVFDDASVSGDAYAVARAQALVSAEEAAAVEPFHATLDAYEAPAGAYDHEAMLADPKWRSVVAAAKAAQSALMPLNHDPEERRALTQVSIHAVEAGANG